MALNDLIIRNAKPLAKAYKLTDEKGLFLLVNPNGSRYWRFKYYLGSMASTLLNEQGWNRDAIERQLAHGERNQIRAAYNYAEYLPERRKMMQHWSDYLQSLMERE